MYLLVSDDTDMSLSLLPCPGQMLTKILNLATPRPVQHLQLCQTTPIEGVVSLREGGALRLGAVCLTLHLGVGLGSSTEHIRLLCGAWDLGWLLLEREGGREGKRERKKEREEREKERKRGEREGMEGGKH